MWHLRDCAACCRLQDSSKTLETEQPGYFRALHANASSCCRQCQSRKQRKRQTGGCKGIRQWGRRGKGKATHAARTCQKTFWKPSIGRNNNDRWQSTRGRWEQKIRGRGRDSTHHCAPCYMPHARGSVSNWLSHQVVDMYGKSFAPAFLQLLLPPPSLTWAGQFPGGVYLRKGERRGRAEL